MPSAGPGREVVIEESNAVRRQRIVLPSMSPGTERSLVVLDDKEEEIGLLEGEIEPIH